MDGYYKYMESPNSQLTEEAITNIILKAIELELVTPDSGVEINELVTALVNSGLGKNKDTLKLAIEHVKDDIRKYVQEKQEKQNTTNEHQSNQTKIEGILGKMKDVPNKMDDSIGDPQEPHQNHNSNPDSDSDSDSNALLPARQQRSHQASSQKKGLFPVKQGASQRRMPRFGNLNIRDLNKFTNRFTRKTRRSRSSQRRMPRFGSLKNKINEFTRKNLTQRPRGLPENIIPMIAIDIVRRDRANKQHNEHHPGTKTARKKNSTTLEKLIQQFLNQSNTRKAYSTVLEC